MTEAELQRLAEIINEMSSMQTSVSFNYWQVMSAVAAGVLINGLTGLASHFIKNFNSRRQNLRDSRKRLYGALLELRNFLEEVPDFASLAKGEEVWKRNSERHIAIWAKINSALNLGNDAKYARVIMEKLNFTVYQDTSKEIQVVNRLIKSLEPQVLSVTERSFDEQRTKMGRNSRH